MEEAEGSPFPKKNASVATVIVHYRCALSRTSGARAYAFTSAEIRGGAHPIAYDVEWLMSNDFKAEGGHAFCGLPLNMWPSRLITGLVVVETDRPQGHDPIQHNHCREAIGMSWLPIGSGRCWLEIAPACRCRSSAEAIPAEVRSALRPELHEALRQSVPAVRRSGKRSRDSELECGEKRPLTVC